MTTQVMKEVAILPASNYAKRNGGPKAGVIPMVICKHSAAAFVQRPMTSARMEAYWWLGIPLSGHPIRSYDRTLKTFRAGRRRGIG